MKDYIFTSESVTEGHPDKLADQISDSVLDALLEHNKYARVACETLVTTGLVVVAGEVTTKKNDIDLKSVIRDRILKIGYNSSEIGLDGNSCEVMLALDEQSPDIALGVDAEKNKEQGAGDQGIMFGYAINETENLMPLSIDLSHRLSMRLAEVRKSGELSFLRPDGKVQVSVEYRDGKVARIDTIVVSTQHSEDVEYKILEEALMETVIKKVIPHDLIDKKTKYFINPTGRFIIGGPQGDCGLTGRKIIVDTYGGHGGHGGGAFSGKDPSKVDRSAAYAARHLAKHIVAAGCADRCLVQLAYAIGLAAPVSFNLETYGTEKVDLKKLCHAINSCFDFSPAAIIERLNLLRPIYAETAAYGHFGRISKTSFSWENLNLVDKLKSYL